MLGLPEWKQCENEGIVMLRFKSTQDGDNTKKIYELPACQECWQRCIDSKQIKILEVLPILKKQKEKNG